MPGFWPGFLASEKTGRTDGTDGTDGRGGRDGRTDGPDGTGRTDRADGRDGRTGGRTGRTDGTDGRTEYSFTVLLGRRNTVLQYYLLFTIYFLKNPKIYFTYYIILFKIALNSLFIDQGVYIYIYIYI